MMEKNQLKNPKKETDSEAWVHLFQVTLEGRMGMGVVMQQQGEMMDELEAEAETKSDHDIIV